MKQAIKRHVGPSAWDAARDAYDFARRLPEIPAAYLHPWRRASMRNLNAFRDVHRGKRCFVIGNGPSLKKLDLQRLRGEFSFGMNRIYPLFTELGFGTTYYVSINDLVIEQCAKDICSLAMPRFLAWRSHRHIHDRPDNLNFLYTTYNEPVFARNAAGRLWEGATVTYVALQLAFHMGFAQAILIGVDHNFVSQGKANETVTSQGDDPNHFSPQYFGKGFRWQLPDLETSERSYRMAREAYRDAGREVLDATLGGKLTVFPKVEYNSLF